MSFYLSVRVRFQLIPSSYYMHNVNYIPKVVHHVNLVLLELCVALVLMLGTVRCVTVTSA